MFLNLFHYVHNYQGEEPERIRIHFGGLCFFSDLLL